MSPGGKDDRRVETSFSPSRHAGSPKEEIAEFLIERWVL